MKYSLFGQKLGSQSGIVSLMEDLGEALNVNPDILFLGGGNPAQVPEFEACIAKHMHSIANDSARLHKLLGVYQSPRGAEDFIQQLLPYLHKQLGHKIKHENIAVISGSQSAFFILLNMFAGHNNAKEGKRHIVFPMMPEYLGYADQTIEHGVLKGFLPKIEETGDRRFKYYIDKDSLTIDENCVAMCVSRPTNPTGNILTQDEMAYLTQISKRNDVPLIVDCAYGDPFPGIAYGEAQPYFDPANIYVLSCSKLGLPGVRTGVVIAPEEIINRIVNINTLVNLANGNFGPTLMTSLLQSGELAGLCQNNLLPFYRNKRDFAIGCIEKHFDGVNYALHEPEGAFFLWLWFKDLPITTEELYQRLKRRGVLIMDGSHFFFGHEQDYPHAHQCVRLTYCQSEEVINKGIQLLAEELRSL